MQNFTNAEILSQLMRVLSSSQLSSSNVLSEFLNFIVRETLNGRGEELKEYTIGVHALKKESDFNPQLDSIVRIHAGRLRRSLKEYYYEDGQNDPIVISIPKGTYIPAFELRRELVLQENGHDAYVSDLVMSAADTQRETFREVQVAAPSAPNKKPAIAVLPFNKIGRGELLEYFTRGIGEYICTELTNFQNLKVISYYTAGHTLSQAADIQAAGLTLGADFILTGSVHLIDKTVRVYVQLNDVTTGDQVWAHTFENKHSCEQFGQFLDEVVEKTLADIAGLNGAIARSKPEQVVESEAPGKADSTVYWYRQYLQKFEVTTITQARKYYEGLIKRQPNHAFALAYLSEILSGETLITQSKDTKIHEQAAAYARRAIEVDPYCQQAYLSLAIHYLLIKRNEECVHILEEGLEINPQSLDYRGAMGALLIFSDNFEDGMKILDKVLKLKTHLPWWQILSYSFYSYYKAFYADALFWADRANMNVAWIPIVKAACFAQLGQIEDAQKTLFQLKRTFPLITVTEEGLRKLFSAESLVQKLIDGLAKIQ